MRLGHAGEKALQILVKQTLLKSVNSCKLEVFEHCVMGKQIYVKFGLTIHDTKGILNYVHSDVRELTKTVSLGGMHYFEGYALFSQATKWILCYCMSMVY